MYHTGALFSSSFKAFDQSAVLTVVQLDAFVVFSTTTNTPSVLGLQHIFDKIALADNVQYLVRASYLEIYNEEIRDLLSKV